jgi:hypothetical protein
MMCKPEHNGHTTVSVGGSAWLGMHALLLPLHLKSLSMGSQMLLLSMCNVAVFLLHNAFLLACLFSLDICWPLHALYRAFSMYRLLL